MDIDARSMKTALDRASEIGVGKGSDKCGFCAECCEMPCDDGCSAIKILVTDRAERHDRGFVGDFGLIAEDVGFLHDFADDKHSAASESGAEQFELALREFGLLGEVCEATLEWFGLGFHCVDECG